MLKTCRAILLLLTSILFSCSKHQHVSYKFTSLDLNHLNDAGGTPLTVSADSLPSSIYGIRLNLHPSVTTSNGNNFDKNESQVICDNKIISISITSNDSFALNYPAGTLLNSYFAYYQGNSLHVTSLTGSAPFYPTAYYMPDYASQPVPYYADLLLMKAPAWSRKHIFKIQLDFKDGTRFIDSTTLIKLY